jgi:hypothetical protein
VIDFIEIIRVMPERALQRASWRINELASLQAGFAQCYPQDWWKVRNAVFNHGLRLLL